MTDISASREGAGEHSQARWQRLELTKVNCYSRQILEITSVE
jgi:hypothetical protein